MSLGTDVGIFAISVLAGVIGALAGVGGGILVIPALTMVFGVDIRLASGASSLIFLPVLVVIGLQTLARGFGIGL